MTAEVCYRLGAGGLLGRRSGLGAGVAFVAWTECGASCLSLVGPRICLPVGGTREIPVEALFPQGRESFEVASSSGWSGVWELMPKRGQDLNL